MSWNLIYALVNAVLGLLYHSFWFLSMAAYYLLLGIMRWQAVMSARLPEKHPSRLLLKRCGWGMLALAVAISGIVCMAIAEKHNPRYHIIVMITIAAYTFYLIVISVINTVKARKHRSVSLMVLKNISLAAAVGSVLSLERSMLGTFGDAADSFSFVMETCSGAAAFLLLLCIGVEMLRRARQNVQDL